MNIILIIGTIILGIVLVIAIYGMTLPRISKMQRSITIKSSPSEIYKYTNNLKLFVKYWSPWTEKDPNMNQEFNDIESGVGALYKWQGEKKKVGTGVMKIVKNDENKSVDYTLKFGGQGDADVSIGIAETSANECEVTWYFSADQKNNPVGRIFGSMMDKFLGPDYEKGLSKLKAVCEN